MPTQLSDMLVFLRKRKGLSQQELSELINIKRSTIGMYETGKREPDLETLEIFADFYNVDMNTLTGRPQTSAVDFLPYPNIQPMPNYYEVPRLGTIACGEPILAVENHEGVDEIPSWVKCDFTLVCKGDSMINARIFDGDIVCIKQQPTVENGEVAAVLINDEITLKRFRQFEDRIVLEAENPIYKPIVIYDNDGSDVRIVGKAVYNISLIQ